MVKSTVFSHSANKFAATGRGCSYTLYDKYEFLPFALGVKSTAFRGTNFFPTALLRHELNTCGYLLAQ